MIINNPELERLGYVGFNVSDALNHEMNWLGELFRTRLQLYMRNRSDVSPIYQLPTPPNFMRDITQYGNVVLQCAFKDRVIIAMALAVHIRPSVYDIFFSKDPEFDRAYTAIGGVKGRYHNGFLPTLDTVAFVLGGEDIGKRIEILECFKPDFWLVRNGIVYLDRRDDTEPVYAAALQITDEYLSIFTTNKVGYKPDFSANFSANLLTTNLTWSDLQISDEIHTEISKIRTWVQHEQEIIKEWGYNKHLKKGYKALFYGASGTGKTLTATLLGVELGLDVYRIDVSRLVSKYIGETSKNLARLFDEAKHKRWILFFDEAESLFGKRFEAQSLNDSRHAQEIGYLLQRIEQHEGVVILATNLLDNVDKAFMRRFQSLIHFQMPDERQRLALWNKIFKNTAMFSEIDFVHFAKKYELTGSNIANILRDALTLALQYQKSTVDADMLEKAIHSEIAKSRKIAKIGF